MKHSNFYRYQIADVLFNTSIKTIGILFTWIMLNDLCREVSLGYFIATSWFFQVLVLLLFSFVKNTPDEKKTIFFCTLMSLVSVVIVNVLELSYFLLGLIFVVTSVCTILFQPMGSSIISKIYEDNDTSHAFRIRGFVSSMNTIMAPAISGLIITQFSYDVILQLILAMVLFTMILFSTVKDLTTTATHDESESSNINMFKVLMHHPVERLMVTMSALANFIVMPLIAYVIPYKIVQVLSFSAIEVGLSEAMFGLGMIIGSAVINKSLNKHLGKHRVTYLSVLLMSCSIVVTTLSNTLYPIYLGMFLCGLGVVIFNINTTTIRCSATPKILRAPFESSFLAICIIFIPIGVMITTYAIKYDVLVYLYLAISFLIAVFSVLIKRKKDFEKLCALSADDLEECYPSHYPSLY